MSVCRTDSAALEDHQRRRRTGSQVLKHAIKFGLKRSQTTKVAASQASEPTTLSFSTSASFPRRYSSLSKKNNNQFSDKLEIPYEDQLKPTKLASNDHSLPGKRLSATAIECFTALHAIPEQNQEQRPSVPQQEFLSGYDEPQYYRAFLSSIAGEMKKRIVPSDRIKNGIEYVNVFDGKKAVDVLTEILCTTDRMLALRIGQALEAQRFFHEVSYEKRLVDDVVELYQFNDLLFHAFSNNDRATSTSSYGSTTDNSTLTTSVTSTTIDTLSAESEKNMPLAGDDDRTSVKTDSTANHHYHRPIQQRMFDIHSTLPNGIYTDLTYCYSPTCNNLNPCYSPTCPKRSNLRKRTLSETDTREKQSSVYSAQSTTKHELWSHTVDDYIVFSLPTLERKRQETIFELIYTEENFCNDLDYVVKLWIEPLQRRDIIPKHQRKAFIKNVFSNLITIRDISRRLTSALRERQAQHPIVASISDVLESFIDEFSPFVDYGANQHYAKYLYEMERCTNMHFAQFAEQTEKNKASRKLELNGYLTKPTSRLGRYTLLLDKIYDCTASKHLDKVQLPVLIKKIKRLLQQVNESAGDAMNRFHLKQMHYHLSFKNKRDTMELHLLNPARKIIKQGVLRKSANLDSTEYRLILLDNYVVVAKVKRIMATEYYCIQRRPIPIELLDVDTRNMEYNLHGKLSTTSLLSSRSSSASKRNLPHPTEFINSHPLGYPICFQYYGKSMHDTFTLYAPNETNRNTWIEIIQQQQYIKMRRTPVFNIRECAKRYEFFADIKAHHMVLFDHGSQFMLATEAGLYVGPNQSAHSGIPRKILPLEKITQIHVLEEFGLLLVLADHTLWQYPLDIVINARPNGYENTQHFGRKIRTNVPFFHVGVCFDQTLICVPNSLSVNGTVIELYTPIMPKTEVKKKTLFEKLSSIKTTSLSLINTQVTALKSIYTPSEVWAIDNTRSIILLTTPVGVIAVDYKTKKADGLLDPMDKHLKFITRMETIDEQLKLHKTVKRVAVFSVPSGHYLICYDQFAFFIDKKGRRAQHDFKIEWEGHPTAFAYHHPYVIAFQNQFIEIRDSSDGQLRQVIHGKNMNCLQNGHKSKGPEILAAMLDPTDPAYQFIFELQPVPCS